MNSISCMGANFVARQLGYQMPEGWLQGDQAANQFFAPLETFPERFGALLAEVRSLGFDCIDIWTAHLNFTWATAQHLAVARDLLALHSLSVGSYAGGYGTTLQEFDMACRVAVALEAPILGGTAPTWITDRRDTLACLQHHGLRLAIENHPGTLTATEMLERLGDADPALVGTTVDTGWYGTAGVDAVSAISQLGDRILLVHLKDVLAPGGHQSCRFGGGCVPIEACVQTLRSLGYRGAFSIEHNPAFSDPGEVCKENLTLLRGWLQ